MFSKGPIQGRLGTLIVCLRKGEISEGAQHKGMPMTKGQRQLLNNGLGTNSIRQLHGFLRLPPTVPHYSHVIFHFNHFYFHFRGSRLRGVCADLWLEVMCLCTGMGPFRFFFSFFAGW